MWTVTSNGTHMYTDNSHMHRQVIHTHRHRTVTHTDRHTLTDKQSHTHTYAASYTIHTE